MIAALLGVPLYIWGFLCLLVSAIYVFYSPGAGNKNSSTKLYSTWRYLVLRWFHSLVWALLALSCFIWGEYLMGGKALANFLAIASLALYIIFIATFILERRRPQNRN